VREADSSTLPCRGDPVRARLAEAGPASRRVRFTLVPPAAQVTDV
jgi:hypothetical protein